MNVFLFEPNMPIALCTCQLELQKDYPKPLRLVQNWSRPGENVARHSLLLSICGVRHQPIGKIALLSLIKTKHGAEGDNLCVIQM